MAPEIGQELKRARESRGLELSEVERVIKIRPKYLSAMEEDRWADLPGRAYGRGFLATYARFLGLDEQALVERYKAGPGQAGDASPVPEEMLPRRGEVRKHPLRPRTVAKAVGALALVAIVVLVVVLAAGGDDGEGGAGEMLRGGAGAPEQAGTTGEQGSGPESGSGQKQQGGSPAETRLKLLATGSVWVCVVDNRDRARVDGETLEAGEERGPLRGSAFAATFGNGELELTVNGESVEVPAAAEPLGYRINPNGVNDLDEADRPDCA